MNIYQGWDEQTYKRIARKCGSVQLNKDIDYCKFVFFHDRPLFYAERIDEIGLCVGRYSADWKTIRIICIGVAKEHQGEGLGQLLLFRLLEQAKAKGATKVTTRTLSGKRFYEKWGGLQVVGKKGGDYLMEGKL